ncbi:hypothetical protein PF008_g21067 [Phytophthora fragariae]|uniref:Uncharacterized protein n=1 Tax=Phytophthora fragariae TaxID=53985 RepID=A0A6G0QXW4_9STRA|nr:hypothetical protein PF008_g21067 [Phytophthora fragariae]
MMKRMEDLEAREAAGERAKDQEEEEEESTEAQAAAPTAKGNDAFSRRCFQASNKYYLQVIELDPISHILNGNRAAAYHRLKKYKLALEDSDVAMIKVPTPVCVLAAYPSPFFEPRHPRFQATNYTELFNSDLFHHCYQPQLLS